jgi:hypothetical protein
MLSWLSGRSGLPCLGGCEFVESHVENGDEARCGLHARSRFAQLPALDGPDADASEAREFGLREVEFIAPFPDSIPNRKCKSPHAAHDSARVCTCQVVQHRVVELRSDLLLGLLFGKRHL